MLSISLFSSSKNLINISITADDYSLSKTKTCLKLFMNAFDYGSE